MSTEPQAILPQTMSEADEAIVERLRAEPPRPGLECPVCLNIFEAPFTSDGRRIGHVPGSRLCLAARSRGIGNRDARRRREAWR